jgi:hypothetical protein
MTKTDPTCQKCHGTGWYQYDFSGLGHSTVCDACCKHDKGWWKLGEMHSDPGKWCCRAGCGAVIDELPEECHDQD